MSFSFQLYPKTILHMSSEDTTQSSKWSRELDKEWHVNAVLNNSLELNCYFRLGWDLHI
jgi:hypothetical protein